MNIELSEVMNEKGKMINWAKNVVNKKQLSEEEVAISEAVNKFAEDIANTGATDRALSEYLIRIVEEEVYNEPSELLDIMFNQGEIGEFDDYLSVGTYKNNLMAYESSIRGGSVDKSYVDFKKSEMKNIALQIETEIRYDDLRRNGALTIAQLTLYAVESMQNKKFKAIFEYINSLLTSSDPNVFDATGGLTVQAMDDFAGYVEDYTTGVNDSSLIVGLTSTLRGVKNMANYDKYLSDNMKEELNMGSNILNYYGGVKLASIKTGKKLADGSPLLPEKTMYGFSGKIGKCDTRGELRVLQTPNNGKEVLGIKFTGYEFVFSVDYKEKISKLTIA